VVEATSSDKIPISQTVSPGCTWNNTGLACAGASPSTRRHPDLTRYRFRLASPRLTSTSPSRSVTTLRWSASSRGVERWLRDTLAPLFTGPTGTFEYDGWLKIYQKTG
jgi:hypothetical protein